MKSQWGRNPGGREISPDRGGRIREWFHRRADHKFQFGVTVMAVTFADSRSGWSAVRITIHMGWWSFDFCPVKWRTETRPDLRVVRTLAEQIRETHGKRLVMQDDDEEEREEERTEAEERERLREREQASLQAIRDRTKAEENNPPTD